MKKCLILLLSLLCVAGAKASFDPLSQWMMFTGDYAYMDNAVNKKLNFGGVSSVVAIADENNGSKVFAVSGKGIFIYDGKQMQSPKVPRDSWADMGDIVTMACDSKNNIWIGTTLGLVKYDGSAFTNIPSDATKLQVITDIAITATDKVYVSGKVMGDKKYVGGGISFYNGTDWTNYNKGNSDIADNTVSDLLLDQNGHLWGIPGRWHDMGVVKFDGKVWKTFNSATGLPTDRIEAICTNSSGKIWLGSPKGVIAYHGGNFTIKPFSNSFSPLLSNYTSGAEGTLDLTSLAIEDNGTVWVGTRNAGLFSFANNGLKLQTQQNSPLINNSVLKMSIDKEARKWIVAGYKNSYYDTMAPMDLKNRTHTVYISSTGGVTVYKEHNKLLDPKWTVYDSTRSEMQLGHASAIDEGKDGSIWMTNTIDGLVNIKGGVITKYRHQKAMESAFTSMYLAPDNKVYVEATVGGLKVLDNGEIKDFAKNPNMGGIDGITYDKDNVVWVSGQGGISHFVNGDWQTQTKGDGLPANVLYFIMKDSKNNLWAGSAKGLVKYETTWQEVGKDVDFPSNDFTTMAEDSKGNLWLGTNKGICMYDGKTFTLMPKIESLDINKYRVNKICVDKNNVVWIGTESYGVLRYDGTTWTQLNKKNTGAMYDKITALKMGSDGKLYVASESSSMNEFDVNLPHQSPEEMMRQELTKRVKMADPKHLLTVIQY